MSIWHAGQTAQRWDIAWQRVLEMLKTLVGLVSAVLLEAYGETRLCMFLNGIRWISTLVRVLK